MPKLEPFMGDTFFKGVMPRIEEYLRRHSLSVSERLGYGKDGLVYSTTAMTVVKGLKFQEGYERERNVYQHLERNGILKIKGFAIPKLVRFDDDRLIIEMRQVAPPFIIDFASAGLGRPLFEYDENTLREAYESQKENFGDDWEWVQSALSELRYHGIFFSDVSTNNIRCRGE